MDIELIINDKVENEKIVIYAKEKNQKITDIVNKISIENEENILGYKNDEVFILDKKEIWNFYTCDNKVFAKTVKGEFLIKYRIYQLEEILENTAFIKISNSEIINMNMIESLQLSKNSTILFKFKDGSTTYASRRNINKIKEYLNL